MSGTGRGRTAVTRGANAHKLASSSRLTHGSASLAERPSFPSAEATMQYLDALMCPFCELGPFRLPLGHISAAHGVSAPEMRAYLGVPRVRSFSNPDTFMANREKGLGAPNLDIDARRKRADQARNKAAEKWKAFLHDWLKSDQTEGALLALMTRHDYRCLAKMRRRLREAGKPMPVWKKAEA